MAPDFDIEALGLLDGLQGHARTERAELIAWLLDRGFSIEQIRASAAAPLLLPANRVMGEDGTYLSARQICDATGLDLQLLQRLEGALGLPRIDDPDAAVLPRVDAEAAAHAKVLLDIGFDTDDTIAIMRVLMKGLENAAARMRLRSYKMILYPGASEIELAEAAEALARQSVPLIGPMVGDLLLLQLRHSFESDAITAAERAAGTVPGARQVAVAFADLAGFTQLGESLPPEELERVASRLADLASDVAIKPVRFIKAIGDAVMLVCAKPVPLLDAVLDLVVLVAKVGLPSVRVGLAFGGAVSRAGDWFGSPVNMASRVTAVARPGTVVITGSVRDMIADAEGFEFSYVGARRLKGITGDVKLFTVARNQSRM